MIIYKSRSVTCAFAHHSRSTENSYNPLCGKTHSNDFLERNSSLYRNSKQNLLLLLFYEHFVYFQIKQRIFDTRDARRCVRFFVYLYHLLSTVLLSVSIAEICQSDHLNTAVRHNGLFPVSFSLFLQLNTPGV